MIHSRCNRCVQCVLLIFFVLFSTGCVVNKTVKVRPSMEQYVFLNDIKPLDQHYKNFYDTNTGQEPRLAARISEPDGYTIKFHNNPAIIIGEPASRETLEPRTFLFQEGVYPFSMYKDKKDKDWYSGLLVVYNIDETIELATFGESEETRMLNMDMFWQAEKGVLANYTISFDDKEVIRYWLGNRDNLYPGGQPTVEVDFTSTPGLQKLKIDGQEVKSKKKVLKLDKYYVCSLCDEKSQKVSGLGKNCKKGGVGGHRPYLAVTHKNYPIEMTMANGKRFQGYIRNLATNIFTAFMSIPCEIPPKLFNDAATGTIAKLTVYSASDNKKEVAEIVFGLAK